MQSITLYLHEGAQVAQWVRSLDLTAHTSLSPIWFAPSFVNYKKGCTRLAAANDKVHQLLAQGWWFSPDSATTKTGPHDIAEIWLKVALNTKNSKFKLYLHEPQVYCFYPTRFLNQMIFKVVSAVTWWVPLVKQDYLPLWSTRTPGLLTSLEHPNSGATDFSEAPELQDYLPL